jgi:hypothetical protein
MMQTITMLMTQPKMKSLNLHAYVLVTNAS